MKHFLVWLGASWLALGLAHAREPVLRVVATGGASTPILQNGDFEAIQDARARGWSAGPMGYRLAQGEGRGGSKALVCEDPTGDGWFGASQMLALNRTSTAPLVVRGWSKAENVSGGADSGYSLYADLVYADGTTLWGQTGNFRCGTHDWEQREFVILPDKSVKTLTLHCLFRGHAGRAWFDDVSVDEVKAGGGAVLFQGVPVVAADVSPRLTLANQPSNRGALTGVATNGLFLARDVASHSDVYCFDDNAIPELGLRLAHQFIAGANHVAVQGRVSDITGKDRAVTLLFALPLDATGWRWGDDIRCSRVIEGNAEFVNQVAVRCGATGTQSLYPLAAVWDERIGLALGLDMAKPAVYRVGYHAGLKMLFIAYDFGLVKDTVHFPSSADFRFVIYRFDPKWGFRAAWQKYMEIFPDSFVVRAREQGLWMPFTDVSKVQGWEDFGFRFHEGNNNVPWDDEHGVLSFRYTEPMTWWMRMKKGVPRTFAEAIQARDQLADGPNDHQRQMAEVSKLAAMHDEANQPALLFRNEPWCDGAVWSLNPNPWLDAVAADVSPQQDLKSSRVLTNAATIQWNDALKDALYGAKAKGKLDGEYLDSLEGYVTADLNFRREHFRDTTVPPTFSADTKQPALFKGLAVLEFTKWMADDVHRMGKLMFANGVPYRFTYLCPSLDVLGTETDWLRAGKYHPAPFQQMDLWRTLSGAKPYLLLMNTDYDKFTPDIVEQYFQRCLFYGMWPGFFSHNAADNPYWQNPKWYNRDRPLFRKYIPVIRRVAEVGWQPVTGASCDNEKISVERFGPDARGAVYFTLHNDTRAPQAGRLRLELAALGLAGTPRAQELVAGQSVTWAADGLRVSLAPQETKVICLGR
jgi:hypothetical protein